MPTGSHLRRINSKSIPLNLATSHTADYPGVTGINYSSDSISSVLKSSGKSMSQETLGFMESRFGHHFGEIKIHTDSRAARSAKAIDARAYTSGNHIVFGENQFDPSSHSGKRLLAHELTHTLQQSGRPGQIQRQLDSIQSISFYRKAPNFCMDDELTGLLHEDKKNPKVCFRQFPLHRSHYKDCPPGYHFCFNKITGELIKSESHIDRVSPVDYKKADNTCKLHPLCSIEHGLKDRALQGIAEAKGIDSQGPFMGEGQPRDTNLF